MDIYLVRHGEAAASWAQSADPGLSELGQRQAEQVAGKLSQHLSPEVQLLSSPLLRALETARPLASALDKQIVTNDVFREIPAPVPLEQRQTWLRQFMRERWDTQVESLHQWRDSVYQQLLGLHEPTVVFTHFLVINAVVGRIQQREETLCFWPDNASITHLTLTPGSLALVKLGDELSTVVN